MTTIFNFTRGNETARLTLEWGPGYGVHSKKWEGSKALEADLRLDRPLGNSILDSWTIGAYAGARDAGATYTTTHIGDDWPDPSDYEA